MNPVLGSGALHIAVNGKTGEVAELHWLAVRVKGKRRAPDGGIYLIAQTLDRGLYQLLRYQSDGQLTVLLENGDKSLYQLWAGNDKLVAQTDNGDARLSLIFDLRSSDVRYRQPLEYRYNGRDDARQTVIEPESHYGDDGSPTALLRPLSFHHAVNMKNLPCCWCMAPAPQDCWRCCWPCCSPASCSLGLALRFCRCGRPRPPLSGAAICWPRRWRSTRWRAR